MRKRILKNEVKQPFPHLEQAASSYSVKTLPPNVSPLLELSEDLLDRILPKLPAKSQIAISQTCKMLQEKMHHPSILRKLSENHKLLPAMVDKHLGLRDYFLCRVRRGTLGGLDLRKLSEDAKSEIAKLYVQRILVARTDLNLDMGVYTSMSLDLLAYRVVAKSFSPNGTRLLTGSKDGFARVWDLTSTPFKCQLLRVEYDFNFWVNIVSFSSGGNRAMTSSANGSILIWDLTVFPATSVALKHNRLVEFASFSKDGTHIITVCSDDTVRVWDLTATPPTFINLEASEKKMPLASLSADATRAVTIAYRGKPRIWDLTVTPAQSTVLHVAEPEGRQYFKYPDGIRGMIDYNQQSLAQIWNLTVHPATYVQLEGYWFHCHILGFSPDGTHVVTKDSANGEMGIWNLTTKPATFMVLEEYRERTEFIGFSPDGTRMVTGYCNGMRYRVWNLTANPPTSSELHRAKNYLLSSSFSPDGTRLLCFGDDGQLHVWDFSSNPGLLDTWLKTTA